jgi:hypothetical protein
MENSAPSSMLQGIRAKANKNPFQMEISWYIVISKLAARHPTLTQ